MILIYSFQATERQLPLCKIGEDVLKIIKAFNLRKEKNIAAIVCKFCMKNNYLSLLLFKLG